MSGQPFGMAQVAQDGADLLDELLNELERFVVFPDHHAAVAVALWIAASHAQDAWETATRLVVKSPLKRCGKSRLLDMVEHLARNVLVAANLSAAALARSVTDSDPPTLVVDEQDAVFATRRGERSESAETLRGLLNAGHQRGRPYVRWDVTTRALERCPTFAMAAIAAIGDLPDTIEDRAVVVGMRRRAPGERVTPFRRRRHAAALLELRDRLHAWVADHAKQLEAAFPDLPVEDRAADTWEPLVAVADLASGGWPQWAREALRDHDRRDRRRQRRRGQRAAAGRPARRVRRRGPAGVHHHPQAAGRVGRGAVGRLARQGPGRPRARLAASALRRAAQGDPCRPGHPARVRARRPARPLAALRAQRAQRAQQRR
jgi:hypothetical protein